MRFAFLIIFLFAYSLSQAQPAAFCVEKSSRNSYVAGNDTALGLYKAIAQTSDTKILLFTIKKTGAGFPTPVIARIDKNGDILWTKALGIPGNYSILNFNAIALNDNSIFLFLIVRSQQTNTPSFYMQWLTGDGNIIRQQSFSLKNNISLGPDADVLKLKEAAAGNVLFMIGSTSGGTVTIGNLSSNGILQWSKIFTAMPNQYFTAVDILTYDDVIIVQGFAYNGLHSTKLRLADGEIISGKCYKIFVGGGGAGLSSRGAVLTTDNKIKTLGSSRIFEHYEIYFSYTQDTALNMVQSTNYFTLSSIISYLPNSVSLNNRGMTLIKSTAGTDPFNIGFFIADDKDSILHEWTMHSTQNSIQLEGAGDDVSFDNNDSLYVYWNGKENGKNIVGWIKTGFNSAPGPCDTKDSSFIQTLPIGMGTAAWTFIKLEEDIFEPTSFAVTIFDPTITKELVCEKITGFCNPIKIKPLDTVCSIMQPVSITVNKNLECRGKILFRFDTAQVKTWQQPNDTTLLLEFDKSWEGDVYATASFCPLVKDSVRLIVNAPLPGITIGKDTSLCKGDSILLFAANGFNSYRWQNGYAGSSFMVKDSGTYYLTVNDNCGRFYTDTVKIKIIDKKIDLGSDFPICKKESIQLKVKGDFATYTWGPSYNISNISLPAVIVNPETTTAYYVLAKTKEGCKSKDTIIITVRACPQIFYVPSAFTPNNDGKNDLLRPAILAPLEKYEFSIYNRWGQQIFRSENKSQGWNGKINGLDQDPGLFIWMCNYKFYDQPAVFKKGTFLLIR